MCALRPSCNSYLPVVGDELKGKRECWMFLWKYCMYMHTHRWNWRLQWCSFDLLRTWSRRQFRNSSQDTLQRRAMLSSCFACVLTASSLFVDAVCWATSLGAWSLFTHQALCCPLSNCWFVMTLFILNLPDQKVAAYCKLADWTCVSVFPCQGHDEHKK